ncbi:MAG TPA: Ldh family oxidoreductase, partial [Acidobacteriaceae bacterium]|nr:Ldh family oxidoreductase [Acidobacteriaceae bacterium]
MASGSPSIPDAADIIRVPFAELVERLSAVLTRAGFDAGDAALCARLFADTTRDGIYTHGVRRFPRLMAMVRNGAVQPKARPLR